MRLQLIFGMFAGFFILFVINRYFLGVNSSPHEISPTPIPCLIPPFLPSLEALITCFNDYTVPEGTYHDAAAYNAAQPNRIEFSAWNAIVTSLLAVDGPCRPELLPAALVGIYTVTLFTELDGKSFCILSEAQAIDGHYVRGWGLMAVPATRSGVSRYIHISAPHPIFDTGTPQQAAALFKNTGAKSLFISGRHRDAYSSESCVSPIYNKTDATHDINEPFFPANEAIRTWQSANGDCSTASCAYIQLHRQISCPTDTTFLSAGIGRSSSSINWYNTVNSPVGRIRTQLNIAFPDWTNSLPSDSTSTCGLTATQNVFGRLLNGIPEHLVCSSGANSTTVTGQFVHIEQNGIAVAPANYAMFATAVNRAIATTCKTGMTMDPEILLCV